MNPLHINTKLKASNIFWFKVQPLLNFAGIFVNSWPITQENALVL